MKKLQVALDLFDTQSALDVLKQVAEFVDIIELGSPLMICEGCHSIPVVKSSYPDKIVFADIKVMDGGPVLPSLPYKAGADMASVMAVSDNATVEGAVKCAREYNKLILVDMCSVKDLAARGAEVAQFKPDFLCIHVGSDIQASGIDPLAQLEKIADIPCAKAVAGGINMTNFEAACQSPADVIIVGSGLYKQPNLRETAKKMYETLNKYR